MATHPLSAPLAVRRGPALLEALHFAFAEHGKTASLMMYRRIRFASHGAARDACENGRREGSAK